MNFIRWRSPARALFFFLCSLLVLPTLALSATESAANNALASDMRVSGTAIDKGEVIPVPEISEKALSYYRSGNVLWILSTVWGLLVPVVFLFTGFSAHIRNLARSMGRKWFFIIGVYVVIYTNLNFLIDFPLDVYQGFIRQHAYELSNQSFSQWLTDSMKSLMIVTIVGALFLWIPYLLLKKSPRRWWFYTAMASVPFLLLFMLIQPIWIAPLFDEFGPMQDKGLEQKILQLADRAGIEGGNVFEVNKSEDTKMLNGYVAGLLNTKRIVLWDTLTEKLNPDQVLVVMGHEMGHYVLGHTWKLVLFFSLLILVILYAVHRTAATMIDRFQHRFGFDKLSDIASLPLLVLLFSVFLLAATPIAFTFTRHLELEADRFGLEITQDNHAMATGLLFLHNQNLRHPRPGILYKLWRSWHPVLADRIEFANTYKPWETGSKLKYANYFRRE